MHGSGKDMLRLRNKQAAGVYSGGELIAGDITKPQNVTEFIVAERCITNPYSEWKIAGKIVPMAVAKV